MLKVDNEKIKETAKPTVFFPRPVSVTTTLILAEHNTVGAGLNVPAFLKSSLEAGESESMYRLGGFSRSPPPIKTLGNVYRVT